MGLRVLWTVVAVVMVVSSLGCSITRPRTVPKNDYVPYADEKILSVQLLGGGEVSFDDGGGNYSTDDRVIRGTSKAGEDIEIGIDDVQSVRVDRVATGLSLTATFAGLLGLAVAIMYTIGMHGQWLSE